MSHLFKCDWLKAVSFWRQKYIQRSQKHPNQIWFRESQKDSRSLENKYGKGSTSCLSLWCSFAVEFCQGLPRVARERRRGLHLPDSSHTPEKSFRSRLRAFFRCSTSQGVLLLSVYNTEATRPRARNNVPTWRSGTEPIGRNPSALISGSSWRGLEETVEKFASLRDETIMEESKPSGGAPE